MQDSANSDANPEKIVPPSGDPEQAEKYVSKLIDLVNNDKVLVDHTDLSKFDPSALQDHYRLELKDYNVEVSHSKNPNNGNDSHVILFTNLQNVRDGCTQKIILAYMHLSIDQFKRFTHAAHQQKERIKKAEEEKRLKEALKPIDQALEDISSEKPISSDEDNSFLPAYS